VDENLQTVSTVTSVSSFGVFALAIIKEDSILPGGIIVYNFLSTDDDGKNDFLRIDGLEKTSNSSIKIYNRNGVKVFESKDYTKPGNEFRGFSDGRATLGRGDKLPTGTYFYILEYTYQSKKTRKTGYLHINSKE
jgi:gliding motility-associated-like protein